MTRKKKSITGFSPDKNEIESNEFVDISNFESQKTTVMVNGVEPPLKIGDAIQLEIASSNSDMLLMNVTIGGIIVSSGGLVSYICEWNEGMEIHSETMTLDELKRLKIRIKD